MIYKRLREYFKPYLNRFIVSILCMIGISCLLALSRFLFKPLVDKVFIAKDIKMLYILIGAIPSIYLVLGILMYIKNYLMLYIAQRVTLNIRNEMYEHLQHLPLVFYSKGSTGEIMSRLTNDVFLLQIALSRVPATIVCDGFTVIALLCVLLYLHWKLAIISIAVFFLAVIPIREFSRKMRGLSRSSQEQMGGLYSHLQESVSGINITKAFNREDTEVGRFKKVNMVFYELMMSFARIVARTSPIMEFIGALAVSLVIFFAARDVLSGIWTTGGFIAFISAAFSAFAPIKKIVELNPQIQQALAASRRIFSLLDEKSQIIELPDACALPVLKTEIKYDDVSFEYVPGHKVLENVSFQIRAGEILAVVGHSGEGKSTVANLLLRFYDPSEGRICIDGHDIRKATLKSLREQIGVVTQETILFNETVRYNIAYGKKNATEDEIINSAITANAHEFIMKMPNGYDTIIGERGTVLSGGEKQRLAIARAIIKNPRILILDEATSALDAESEKIIQDALEKIIAEKTVLLIAHRLSTIKRCDRIIVLDRGRIVDSGKHDELLRREGVYKRLHQLQLI